MCLIRCAFYIMCNSRINELEHIKENSTLTHEQVLIGGIFYIFYSIIEYV